MIQLLTLAFAISNASAAWKVDLSKIVSGSVEFTAIGSPSALKIKGQGKAPTGQAQIDNLKVQGKFSFELNTLTTGISLRDNHMKEKYLQTKEFPFAELTIDSMQLPATFEKLDTTSNEIVAEDIPFTGKLKVHGVENAVQGKAKIKRKGTNLSVEAQFETPIQAYKIDTPSFAGISITKNVVVYVQFEAPVQFNSI
jgi:polyisoprenoid-binding protein YceI